MHIATAIAILSDTFIIDCREQRWLRFVTLSGKTDESDGLNAHIRHPEIDLRYIVSLLSLSLAVLLKQSVSIGGIVLRQIFEVYLFEYEAISFLFMVNPRISAIRFSLQLQPSYSPSLSS